jgi:uncharacterized protein DUF4276
MEQRRAGRQPLVKIKLYIEGGGDSHLQDTEFRAAWAAFFEKAGLKALRKMPATFRGGGRDQTFDAYCTAVKNRRRNELPLLLVDSEDLVTAGHSVWKHLKERDGWNKPPGAGSHDAFIMITCMETWFVADRAALKQFFHDCWRDQSLPKWPRLEVIEKAKIFRVLDQATSACGARKYSKGKVSFDLLQSIDPAVVAMVCPAAKALLDRLRNI